LDDGLAALEGGRTVRIDACYGSSTGGSFWFVNLAGAGFVARVARRALQFKFLGSLAYVLATLAELPGLKSRSLTVVADGVTSTRDAVFIEVCNSRKTGGDMIMAPDARLDDGLMNVVIARAMNRTTLLQLFPLIFDGSHVNSPLVETFTCRTLEAHFDSPEPVTPDGELLGDSPLKATVHSAVLEVFTL
jgi:diacylglycerol kinase family enzyme